MFTAEELQNKFGKKNISFSEGNEGLTKVTLTHESGATLEIYLKGAHITSYKTNKKEELLFLSSKTNYKSKPIRGGIPVIFPQFGPNGPLVQHGFGRNVFWTVKETLVKSTDVSLTLNIHQDEETLSVWKNSFSVDYTITLNHANSFQMDFKVTNLNESQDFSFTTALHTYFNVENIKKVAIKGLKDLNYDDKILKKNLEELNTLVTFGGVMDRVYYKSPQDLEIICGEKSTEVFMEGFEDCVVWNPWDNPMGDMGVDDWTRMVCVEGKIV
jgi:glucose-6-phosphate 1-epimerase